MSDDSIDDPAFGSLRKQGTTWRREIDQALFGISRRVELIVESNNANREIFPERREAYVDFRAREAEILALVESSIGEYVKDLSRENGVPVGESRELVQLTGIVFPMVLSAGERSIGFLLECDLAILRTTSMTAGWHSQCYQEFLTCGTGCLGQC